MLPPLTHSENLGCLGERFHLKIGQELVNVLLQQLAEDQQKHCHIIGIGLLLQQTDFLTTILEKPRLADVAFQGEQIRKGSGLTK